MNDTLRELIIDLVFRGDLAGATAAANALRGMEDAARDATDAVNDASDSMGRLRDSRGRFLPRGGVGPIPPPPPGSPAGGPPPAAGRDWRALETQVSAVADEVEGFSGHVRSATRWLAGFAVALGGVLGGLAATSAALASDAQQIERQARVLGVTTDKYQELRATFEQFGVDSNDIVDLFAQITQQATDATAGGENTRKAFKALGIDVETLKKASPEEVFYLLADGFQRTGNAAVFLDSAGKLMGEDLSKKLIPLLQQGRGGIAAYGAQVRKLGGVLDKDAIQQGVRLQGTLTRIRLQATALGRGLAADLIPAVARIAEGIAGWLDENGALIRGGIVEWAGRAAEVFDAVRDGVEALGDGFAHLAAHKGELALLGGVLATLSGVLLVLGNAGTILAGLTTLGEGVLAIAALLGAGGALAGLPVAVVGLAALGYLLTVVVPALVLFGTEIAAIGLALDDLWTFLTGGESLLGEFVAGWENADGVLGSVAGVLVGVRDLFGALGELLVPVSDLLWLAASAALDFALEVTPLVWVLWALWEVVSAVFGSEALAWLTDWGTAISTIADVVRDMARDLRSVTRDATSLSQVGGRIATGIGGALGGLVPSGLGSPFGAAGSPSTTNNVGGINIQIAGAADPLATGAAVASALDPMLRGGAAVGA